MQGLDFAQIKELSQYIISGLGIPYGKLHEGLERIPKDLVGYFTLYQDVDCGLRGEQNSIHSALRTLNDQNPLRSFNLGHVIIGDHHGKLAAKTMGRINNLLDRVKTTELKIDWLNGIWGSDPCGLAGGEPAGAIPEDWRRLKEEITPEEKERIRRSLRFSKLAYLKNQDDPETELDEDGIPRFFWGGRGMAA
ncbi:MAG: hypothetical protein LBP92_11240 [Deltaproteobacteria bacterium]|jgi:hypothetical protein|nr:hypothetical protein [Deltaproteobacteria bacterium]